MSYYFAHNHDVTGPMILEEITAHIVINGMGLTNSDDFVFFHSAVSADELTAIHESLPDELRCVMDNTFRKRMEFEFHSAGYHVMLETTTGLRTAAGHLVKVCTLYIRCI